MLERLARRHGAPAWTRRGGRLETRIGIDGVEALLVQPRTFMNRSGSPLAELAREREAGEAPFDPGELLVCYDEIDLPLGRIRLRPSGSHAGHNGVRAIIERLGTSGFPRLRVGVAPTSGGIRDAAEFVLRPFRARFTTRTRSSSLSSRASHPRHRSSSSRVGQVTWEISSTTSIVN